VGQHAAVSRSRIRTDLTHYPRESIPMPGGTTFHFVTDEIHRALERATAKLPGRLICIIQFLIYPPCTFISQGLRELGEGLLRRPSQVTGVMARCAYASLLAFAHQGGRPRSGEF
jgi:hypothetical protein